MSLGPDVNNGCLNKAFDYDVVIAGGGMVGASLALLLSRGLSARAKNHPMKVLVVESFPVAIANIDSYNITPLYSPSFDARSTALSYSSRLILESLGVWPTLSRHISEINNIHVSDKGSFGSSLLRREQVEWPSLGYVVENAWFGNVLLQQLHQQGVVEFLSPAAVKAVRPLKKGVCLTVGHEGVDQSINAQLAIIADGANSTLRSQLGIETEVEDYQQTALIANLSFGKPHQGYAYERFTRQGPMALLPLTDSEQGEPRSALVWSLPVDQAAYLCSCDDTEFLQQLQQQFGHRQGEFKRVGERFTYPLTLVQATEQVRSAVVIMGNAAHSLHPVAGQGFNLALRDCARLSEYIVSAHYQQKPLGELAMLQSYMQQQQFDQLKTIGFSDQLPAIFSSQQLPVSILRAIGLGLLDVAPAVKSQFIYHAAGLHDGAATGGGESYLNYDN